MLGHSSSDTKPSEYCDTSFSAGTLSAARRAAGAVAHAVDSVLLGRNRNAFCVVRPPGHHAGYRGLLDGAKSCGFCIFNNVAAGALHALEGHICDRVAVIDIDVHHGS
jgi:acetoin utilization deacetylase AcuC-like enzyme